jgi:hypothetical protein
VETQVGRNLLVVVVAQHLCLRVGCSGLVVMRMVGLDMVVFLRRRPSTERMRRLTLWLLSRFDCCIEVVLGEREELSRVFICDRRYANYAVIVATIRVCVQNH